MANKVDLYTNFKDKNFWKKYGDAIKKECGIKNIYFKSKKWFEDNKK